jgi:hypothetical protein
VWRKIKLEAGVSRWHENRHTFITGLAESGEASGQNIMDIAGYPCSVFALAFPEYYRADTSVVLRPSPKF